ncbi:hypothetical protein [Streptomyces sp. NPDC101181]|uniref:hypothetical protein n=1 Tax=Streptomyces sp. NPDC101181 TaxID=3366125 RepID=UPI0038034459
MMRGVHVGQPGARHRRQRFEVAGTLGGGLGLLQPRGGLVAQVGELSALLHQGGRHLGHGRRGQPCLGVLLNSGRDRRVQVRNLAVEVFDPVGVLHLVTLSHANPLSRHRFQSVGITQQVDDLAPDR